MNTNQDGLETTSTENVSSDRPEMHHASKPKRICVLRSTLAVHTRLRCGKPEAILIVK